MDGNQAAPTPMLYGGGRHLPHNPSTPMAEKSRNGRRTEKNLFKQPVKVVEMQSEVVSRSSHAGRLQPGVLAATHTASQGLLLMTLPLQNGRGAFAGSIVMVSGLLPPRLCPFLAITRM